MTHFKANVDLTDRRRSSGPSDYLRYFRYYFDYYLAPIPTTDTIADQEDLYVPNHEVGTELRLFLDTPQSNRQLLTGYTGMGKSTVIRATFDLWRDSHVLRGDRIFIPYYCNPSAIRGTAEDYIASGLGGLTQQLTAQLPGARCDEDELWEFINAYKPRILAIHRPYAFESRESDLRTLYTASKFTFYALLLKFLLTKEVHAHFSQIMLVLDDIESIEDKAERGALISFAGHAYDCLVKMDVPCLVKLLIAERPYTRKEFHQNWLSHRTDIEMRDTTSLQSMFQARHAYLVKTQRPQQTQRENWREAFRLLCELVRRIDDRGKELILSLCNYNLRQAMLTLETIVSRGAWFQAGETRQSSFAIDNKAVRLTITRERILKAIAYRDLNVFHARGDGDVGLSNPLKNERDGTGTLVRSLIFQWFVDEADPDFLLGEPNHRDVNALVSAVQDLFPLMPDLPEHVLTSLQEMVTEGLLDEIVGSEAPNKTVYVLMPRGYTLWAELAVSSGLLEILHDDLWLHSEKHSYNIADALTQDSKLEFCLTFCLELAEAERCLHAALVTGDQRRKYREAFGDTTASRHIFRGIERSLDSQYGEGVPEELGRVRAAAKRSVVAVEEVFADV